MEYGKITAETAKMIGGLNAVVYTNADGSIVIEIPYAPDDNPVGLCAALRQTLGERDELFPERKEQITDEDAKSRPYALTAHALDGTHTHQVWLAPGTDWITCNCGSPLFTIMFAEFSDHAAGVVAQCQECGQLLEIQKDGGGNDANITF